MSTIFLGMETSGQLRRRFQERGHYALSADYLDSEDDAPIGHYGGHYRGSVAEAMDWLWATGRGIDAGIFHPTCTFLTGSAAWAFNDPDFERYPGVGYHQRVKPETLVGHARRAARSAALDDVRDLMAQNIHVKIIENPVGAISTHIRQPTQIIQPYEFGDDASKATCLWLLDKDNNVLPRLPVDPAKRAPGRIVNGVERWANQTDSGQNRLSPGEGRWKDRSRTFPGIADALVKYVESLL